MASTNQYPPLAPPPPVPPPIGPRKSLAGPLILVAIGVLFLLGNLGVLSSSRLWDWFGSWWPLLIILWGVIAVIEHASARSQGYRTRHLGGGGTLLLIVLVIAGLIAHHRHNVNWNGIRDQMGDDDDLNGIFGSAFNFEDTVDQSFPAHANLRIVCDHGTLNITPSDGNVIHVVVHKKLYAGNQNDANKYNQGSKPQITVNGDSVLLNANTDGAGDHGVQTDMDISVPEDATLDIASKRGDVTVNNRKSEVKISLQKGDVSLTEIAAAVKINLEKGSIRASQIAGDVDVTGRVDSVNIDDVAGAVRLNGDFYEDIQLSKIAKTVIFKTSRSDMEIASVPGDISISSDEVRGNDLSGPSRVVTGSKNVHLEDVSGDLEIQSNNGDVEVTTSGKQAGKMIVSTQHGAVDLTLGSKSTPDKVTVSTQHGDITLSLPSGGGFQISADTRKGEITSDFDAVKIDQTNGTSRASGTVGNGVSKLLVNTDTGDIKIGKS